jgi:hypothetical protein
MKHSPMDTYFNLICLAVLLLSSGCSDSDSEADLVSDAYTITIGVYSKDNSSNYVATGNELIFNSNEECQSWSRTALGDIHDSGTHLHYNAAAKVLFDNNTTTFSYTEYGPGLDQASIDATCAAGSNGVSKIVNNSSYYQDKPSVFLKIISVEKI